MADTIETTSSGVMDFGSAKNKKAIKSKQANIKKNVDDNFKRSQQAKTKPKDTSKISKVIDIGKNFVDQFMRGFSEVERANITADLDDDLVFRLAEVYDDSIVGYATEEYHPSQQMENAKKLYTGLLGGLSLSLAIKLNKAATESERQKTFGFNAVSNISIKTPKQAAIILDAIGKTDLPNDNHFRINDQHFAIKRHLVRGTVCVLGDQRIQGYLRDDRGKHFTWKLFREKLENGNFFPNMIDDSSTSVDRIRKIGRAVYETATNENIEFTLGTEKYWFRLPKFDLPEEMTIDHVAKILSNAFFEKFKAQNKDMAKAMAGLILSITEQKWLKSPSKLMSELDAKFEGTFFSDFSFFNIMDFCNVWNLNDYFRSEDINNLAIDAINKWNNDTTKTLSRFIDLTELSFTDHGSEAQLIQVGRDKIDEKYRTTTGFYTSRFKGKATSKTPLKTSNHEALMGVFSALTKNLKFKSDFVVEHDKNNRQLLYEFLKKDFKR